MKSPVPPTDEATNNREAIKVPGHLAGQWQSQEGLDTRDHDTQLRASLLLSLNSLQFSKIPRIFLEHLSWPGTVLGAGIHKTHETGPYRIQLCPHRVKSLIWSFSSFSSHLLSLFSLSSSPSSSQIMLHSEQDKLPSDST